MRNKKYKLLPKERIDFPWDNWTNQKMYRIQALRDIPKHGVKAGDLGGYVQDRGILSQAGDCWIGGDAMVHGYVQVLDDAYIGDKAVVLQPSNSFYMIFSDQVKVLDEARLYTTMLNSMPEVNLQYSGSAEFSESCVVQSLRHASGNIKIHGNALLNHCHELLNEADISGNAVLQEGTKIVGKSIVKGNATVGRESIIRNCILDDDVSILPYTNLQEVKMDANGTTQLGSTFPQAITAFPMKPKKVSPAMSVFTEIKASLASYETDIVKLIKYPAMVDQSIPETLALTVALKKASRLEGSPDSAEFQEAVDALEQKFIVAECKAVKMASTVLSPEEQKKAEKAKDLLAIAANEASSENEKKVSFKQAFKQLEGVIAVPEVAVDAFRVKIGLQELESL